MKQNYQKTIYACFIGYIALQIFLLTGCQQEEAGLVESALEMSSQTTTADQTTAVYKETNQEEFSAEDINESSVSEEANSSSGFGEALVTDNMEYFTSLCVCVPYFDDVENLDEYFYAVLVNMSICGPLYDKAEKGNFPCYDGTDYYMARISRTDMEDYMLLLFGKEFPVYEPSMQTMQEEEIGFYYEDGFYYIGLFDPLNVFYTYTGCEMTDNGNMTVEFSMLEALSGKILFELAPADNENGFIIVSKKRQTE